MAKPFLETKHVHGLFASLKHSHLTGSSVDWLPCYRSAFSTCGALRCDLHYIAELTVAWNSVLTRRQNRRQHCFMPLLCLSEGGQGGRTSPGDEGPQPPLWEPAPSPAALPGENHGKNLIISGSTWDHWQLAVSLSQKQIVDRMLHQIAVNIISLHVK